MSAALPNTMPANRPAVSAPSAPSAVSKPSTVSQPSTSSQGSQRIAGDRRAELPGSAIGSVGWLLRAEGLVVLVAAATAYQQLGAGWGAFALLFLLPDLSFLGYLAGPRAGAIAYNAAHAYVAPVALLALGAMGDAPTVLAAGLVWCAHIGFDRMLGYGLKYASGFTSTHLGRVGRKDPW